MPNQSLTINCVKNEITNDSVAYPYFLGAGDPNDLLAVCEAPSFTAHTHNREIASEVLNPPTDHWQRPLNQSKISAIGQRFSQPGEIMPNPILLATNPSSMIEVEERRDLNLNSTGLWKVVIPMPDDLNAVKPLWIIDGQHRLNGLADANVDNSPIPFVLLHSPSGVYRPEVLARIFAQVTTEATALDEIHQAWMQFVFGLGVYGNIQAPHWRAMRTVALLCSTQSYDGVTNPFWNKIKFNPELELSSIEPGGFAFDARELEGLLVADYFRAQGGQVHLTEDQVARAVALAVSALVDIVGTEFRTNPFLGDVAYEQKYFRYGFIAGVCAYLQHHGEPSSWLDVLRQLRFDETDWDTDWVQSTSGRSGTTSKTIANKSFKRVFIDQQLPEGVKDIMSYLQGTGSKIKLQYGEIDENGDRIPSSVRSAIIPWAGNSDRISFDVPATTRTFQIRGESANIANLRVVLESDPHSPLSGYGTISDRQLRQARNKIVLKVRADHYGDISRDRTVTLKLTD